MLRSTAFICVYNLEHISRRTYSPPPSEKDSCSDALAQLKPDLAAVVSRMTVTTDVHHSTQLSLTLYPEMQTGKQNYSWSTPTISP